MLGIYFRVRNKRVDLIDVQMLRDIKYKSRVSIEAFANNFDVEATYALELLRELA